MTGRMNKAANKNPLLEKAGYRLSAWIFLRVLGAIYFIAFASLGSQVRGLIGSHGLLPLTRFLDAIASQLGPVELFWKAPSLFWIWNSDAALCAGAVTGLLLSGLLMANVAPRICCVLLWMLYLSFVSVGQDFFLFQWDNLLLETGFLAIFLAPAHWWRGDRGEGEPSRLARWLFVWLLFRLSIESGLSKWLGGDVAWRNLTAMDYYYETAPIPTWLGWLAHQLPHWFQAVTVVMTFVVEILAPFLLFAPRWWRVRTAALLLMFQVAIALTANYTFFNLLAIALCLFVMDDAFWSRRMRGLQRIQNRLTQSVRQPLLRIPKSLSYGWFAFMILISSLPFAELYRVVPLGTSLYSALSPFRSFNSYGLFAIMTRERWELEIQGSMDGIMWETYPFRYKAGDLRRAPPFVAPHQPRLDFQCWFLTFDGRGDFRHHHYLVFLLEGICSNQPAILGLLGKNPFPDTGPKYLQLKVHRYRMTSVSEKWQTGNYWKIAETRYWSPVMKRQSRR